MTNPTAEPVHLDDGDLLSLVDGGFAPLERDVRMHHVAGCPVCAERLETLRRRATAFSRLMDDVQLPDDFVYPRPPQPAAVVPLRPAARPGWARSAWLRAAIIVLVVAVPFLAVQPLRAWVAERLGAAWGEVRGILGGQPESPPAPAPTTEEPAPAPEQASGATVFFNPAPGRFTLEVVAAQASGTITLGRLAGSEGSAEVIGGRTETPLVSETGLRILNAPASTASYRVMLPPSVGRVRVRVGSGPPIDLTADDLARGRTISLER